MIDGYQWHQLQPADAWFFRDGRPSNRGEDQSDLESEFPPHATSVVGALRAALARQQGWNGRGDWPASLKTVLGDGFEDLGKLSFLGPLLARDGELLFPVPGHVLGHVVEEIGPNRMKFQPVDWLHPGESVFSDAGETRFAVPMGKSRRPDGETFKTFPEPAEGFWVTTAGMSKILSGELPDRDACIHHSELFCQEARVGIERNPKTRTTEKGALYNPRYVRLHRKVPIVMGIAGLDGNWRVPEIFPLGGESRLAHCTPIECPEFPVGKRGGDKCLLTLAAPAKFAEDCWWGAGPAGDAAQLGELLGGKVIGIALDRPTQIGGWNSQKFGPLPLVPFASPGTVWWIDVGNANIVGPVQLGERTAYGFGLALFGAWPE